MAAVLDKLPSFDHSARKSYGQFIHFMVYCTINKPAVPTRNGSTDTDKERMVLHGNGELYRQDQPKAQ